MRLMRLVAVVTCLAAAGSSLAATPATGVLRDDGVTTMSRIRRLRVVRMAKDWDGKTVTLERRDGERIRGRLARVRADQFTITSDSGRSTAVPIDDVSAVTLHPDAADLLLGGLMGVGTAAVAGGVVGLGGGASSRAVGFAAIGGALLGSLLGIRLLHQDTVVDLDAPPHQVRW
ncbi:hypothetical protein HN371_09690 [Candidatus Poribacteria bacterium]|jgi:hypothetical protein|nr:hypothetical protein [Candidatus Poribacteria bacterium]MBT5536893.1 hypothetical protein [Candidatus Poribacteria bacterium]MBT5714910.1 hypothetical protein [Candidatus Poribacteria bacterium]MBT7097779.1 hypothetical protein [Candidatus Poribacteria bacterium]MBT7809688.1 hypothetical protein [Candidatus Poribacteria bacterium]